MSRWNVILAGGVGSRFWPLSTPQRPKQLLPLVHEQPMLRDALDRLLPTAPADRTLILTNASLRDAVATLAPMLPPENILIEPRPAGTCAALAWAAQVIADRDGPGAVMVCTHADWAIADVPAFRDTLEQAVAAAMAHAALVTVGIVPVRPDTGYGYIEPGAPLDGLVRRVARFVEKPDRPHAEQMVAAGFLWNSGIFVWRVGDLLEELRTHTPEVYPALADAHGDAARFFGGVTTPLAIDVGVLERSARVLVVPGAFGWDDVGTWASLHRVRSRDAAGNAVIGPAIGVDAHNNVVHADGPPVVFYGVDDLVVVSREDVVLVTTRDRAADLKRLIEAVPSGFLDRRS
jgi:mannose-1-phosphate guanylyltransferase